MWIFKFGWSLNARSGVFSWEHGWCNCPALQPDSLSVFRFMSSSVTRPAVTVINSAVAQTPSYRAWLAASSISRQLCLCTSSLSLSLPLLETNDLISAIAPWPPSISTARRLILSSPHPSLPRSHLISCFLHTLLHYRFKCRVTRAWCLFCLFFNDTEIVKCSFRLKANLIKAGAIAYLLTCFSQAVGLTGWFKWLRESVIFAVKMLNCGVSSMLPELKSATAAMKAGNSLPLKP